MKESKENDVLLAKWLSGEITDQEVESILGPKELVSYKSLVDIINQFEVEEYDTDQEMLKLKHRLDSEKKPTRVVSIKKYFPYISAAASVLLFAIFYFLFPVEQEQSYLTGIGEQITIELPDGSTVYLNANSKIAFNEDEWENSRDVSLDGEGYFDVVKGASFKVSSKNAVVEVLGTTFNIRDRNNDLEVSCYTGKVGVTKSNSIDNAVVLTPGGILRYGDNYKNTIGKFKKDDVPSWITGVSSFDEVELSIVIEELSNQYGIDFECNQISLDAYFTGHFIHDDLNTALKMVFDAMEISYIVSDKNTVSLEKQ